MPRVHEGKLTAQDKKFGVVVSRFNDLVTTRLLEGALAPQKGPSRRVSASKKVLFWKGMGLPKGPF